MQRILSVATRILIDILSDMAKETHRPRGRPRAEHPKKVLSVAFDPDTLDRLDEMSEKMSVTKGEIVRDAVTRWMIKHG